MQYGKWRTIVMRPMICRTQYTMSGQHTMQVNSMKQSLLQLSHQSYSYSMMTQSPVMIRHGMKKKEE